MGTTFGLSFWDLLILYWNTKMKVGVLSTIILSCTVSQYLLVHNHWDRYVAKSKGYEFFQGRKERRGDI
jgi:hypothetical protein